MLKRSALILSATLGMATATCVSATSSSTAAARAPVTGVPQSRGYFISIDGLNPPLLRALDAAGKLDAPKGLGELFRTSFVVDAAYPVITTLTAPSHVSTITCTPPSRNGVIANSFLSEGKRVSGFSQSFEPEPLWRAAARQGKKVLSLAYVGADALTPERHADFGLAYPEDALLGPHQTLDWRIAELPAASGWQTDGRSLPDAKEATVTLTLNPKSGETRTLQVLVAPRAGDAVELFVDDDKDLGNGILGTLGGKEADGKILNVYSIETDLPSALAGFKRRSFLRLLPHDAGVVSLYVSKASYNNANPVGFRERLDELDLVWPDYGVRSTKLTLAEYVETQSMIDRFLTDVGVRMAPEVGADVVLFYQPLVDSVGHKLQSKLPQPFDPASRDEVTQAFVTAFRIVDANLSRLLRSTSKDDVVALMGDHGMDAIDKVVNVGKLLPADHFGKIEVVSSGSLTLVYAPVAASNDPVQIAQARALGAGLKTALEGVKFEGRPVFGKAFDKADFLTAPDPKGDYAKEWQYGEALWAFTTTSGFYLQYMPLDQNLFVDPPARGMHGQDLSVPTMATSLLIKARGVRPRHVPVGSLIDAVPTFSKLLGIDAPAQCMGKSLL